MKNWSLEVKRWRESGVSQAEYCRRNKLSESKFSYWKKQTESESGKFVSLSGAEPVELVINGVLIKASSETDLVFLRKLLRVIKDA